MINFFHKLFNPHCEHCAQERREQREQLREDRHCVSCESLARENDRLVRENERLLDLLLEKPAPVTEKVTDVRDLKPIQTTKTPFIPTAVRRQMLENESRHSARLRQEAPQPEVPKIEVDKELQALEAELDNAKSERETKVS